MEPTSEQELQQRIRQLKLDVISLQTKIGPWTRNDWVRKEIEDKKLELVRAEIKLEQVLQEVEDATK